METPEPNTPPLPATTSPSPNEKNMAMFAHLSGLVAYLVPLGNIVAPLVIWQIKKDESAFIAQEAKESLNFQITMTIALSIAFILCFVLIGFLILPVLIIADIALVIIAALKASNGEPYRYPLTLRFVK